ncbi:histidine triad nucleotide-binding protein [Candidatus Berkelbacteria bacterium]|nr:histidine triad nucleotide-binding protein [Candidatus Berkelbacteria bacterium]
MENCLFCKIATGKEGTKLIFQDRRVSAFNDIAPKAPIHILIVPRIHLTSVAEMTREHEPLIGYMINVARKIADEQKISSDGYRLVFNTRAHGGQVVDHIHLHLLGGHRLGSMV